MRLHELMDCGGRAQRRHRFGSPAPGGAPRARKGKAASRLACRRTPKCAAFNLLEVMIAVAIFFMCIFSILALVSRSLRAARSLQPMQVDARAAIAFLSMTNRLEEGTLPPEVVTAFERENPGYTVAGQIYEVATNGLFRVDFTVGGASGGDQKVAITSDSSILLFRPMSTSTRFGGPSSLRR